MKRLVTVAAALAFACSLSSNAYALAITDSGVVGTVEAGTQSSNTTNEAAWANYLLSLGANQTTTADAPGDTNSATENYQTGPTDYNGTVSGGVQGATGDYTVSGNYDYVLVKYDGQNAGYVLFNMADWGSSTLPQYSYTIWGANDEQYQISHYTGFCSTGTCSSVPDGGSTVALLGSALFAFGMLARRLRKS
jgi:VPDSG-CTERM motif